MAFNQIAGDQYEFEGTWRLPKSLNLNVRDITDGTDNYLEKLKPEDIDPQGFVGDTRLPAEVGRAMALSRIKNNAEWVTSEDEKGLYLTADRTYINGADGNPIFVPFKELSQLGIADRSFINARLHELKTQLLSLLRMGWTTALSIMICRMSIVACVENQRGVYWLPGTEACGKPSG